MSRPSTWANVDIRKQHSALYKQHKGLDPKNAKHLGKTRRGYRAILTAGKYLKDHFNGRSVIPEKEWPAEYKQLYVELYALGEEYYKLKDEVKNVETLRRSVTMIMIQDAPEQTRRRSQGLSLEVERAASFVTRRSVL